MIEIFKEKKCIIKNDAIHYFEIDEFAFLLDQIIRRYINNNKKELSSIEKLAFITQYNPYYIDPKYCNKIDSNIFDLFDLNNIDNNFIVNFRKMNFEYIFMKNIEDYINKIISKIQNISHFEKIIKLINIKNLYKKDIFLDSSNKKYDIIIKNEIELLSDEKLNQAVKVIAKLIIINYTYEMCEKKFDFIKRRIQTLDKKIIYLIFIEIIKICINNEEKKAKKQRRMKKRKKTKKRKKRKNICIMILKK